MEINAVPRRRGSLWCLASSSGNASSSHASCGARLRAGSGGCLWVEDGSARPSRRHSYHCPGCWREQGLLLQSSLDLVQVGNYSFNISFPMNFNQV